MRFFPPVSATMRLTSRMKALSMTSPDVAAIAPNVSKPKACGTGLQNCTIRDSVCTSAVGAGAIIIAKRMAHFSTLYSAAFFICGSTKFSGSGAKLMPLARTCEMSASRKERMSVSRPLMACSGSR